MIRHKWGDIAYLLDGTERQRAAYETLRRLGIFDTLKRYTPTLVGTIPIGIDVPASDLDIICEANDLRAFAEDVERAYGDEREFRLWRRRIRGVPSVVANFLFEEFPIEVFAQSQPVTTQNAYRHMVVEARLLEIGGPAARRAIRHLKDEGMKTEPAFAQYFDLDGDPYDALLDLYALDDDKLRAAVSTSERTVSA